MRARVRTTKTLGYTLLELMVAVVIVGILGAIAIPSYNGMRVASRIQDGSGDVYTVMAQQERFFLNNSTYTTVLGQNGLGYQLTGGQLFSPEGYYTIRADVCEDLDGNPLDDTSSCVRVIADSRNNEDPDFWLQSDGQKSDLLR